MKVIFTTNLDKYKGAFITTLDLPFVPAVGSFINIMDSLKSHYEKQKLPTRLKVVNVTYNVHTDTIDQRYAVVDLWYDQTDLDIMKQSKINPF